MLAKITVLAPLWIAFSALAGPSAEALLKLTDRPRFPTEAGMSWTIKLTNFNDSSETSIRYKVRSREFNSLVEVLEPPRKRGEMILFNDRVIWFHKIGQSKPVALSSRQRLSGQAAVGDILSTNYLRDYSPTLLPDEKSKDGEDCFVLDLKSKHENTTYDRVRYFVSKKTKLGIQAIFENAEGEPLKLASYEYAFSLKFKGKRIPFPSKITIKNASMEDQYSTIEYFSPKLTNNAPDIFNVNNLLR